MHHMTGYRRMKAVDTKAALLGGFASKTPEKAQLRPRNWMILVKATEDCLNVVFQELDESPETGEDLRCPGSQNRR